MFNDNVDFDFLVNLLRSHIKLEKLDEFNDTGLCVIILAEESQKDGYIWSKKIQFRSYFSIKVVNFKGVKNEK